MKRNTLQMIAVVAVAILALADDAKGHHMPNIRRAADGWTIVMPGLPSAQPTALLFEPPAAYKGKISQTTRTIHTPDWTPIGRTAATVTVPDTAVHTLVAKTAPTYTSTQVRVWSAPFSGVDGMECKLNVSREGAVHPLVMTIVCVEPGAMRGTDVIVQWLGAAPGCRVRATSMFGEVSTVDIDVMVSERDRTNENMVQYVWETKKLPMAAMFQAAGAKTVLTIAAATADDAVPDPVVALVATAAAPVPEPAPAEDPEAPAPAEPAPEPDKKVEEVPAEPVAVAEPEAPKLGAGQTIAVVLETPAFVRTYGGITPHSQWWWGLGLVGILAIALSIAVPIAGVRRYHLRPTA
ncbi:MAG: hypothetical protein WC732_09570 [Candidatus Omnitrophota bacterium]